MLRNPHYVFSLIVAFALGFITVLVLPIGGAHTRQVIAMRSQDQASGHSVHHKTTFPAPVAARRAANPGRPPARQVAVAAPLPRSLNPAGEDAPYTTASFTPRSRWSYPSLTKLVSLTSAPFPYSGVVPRTRNPFLNFKDGSRVGRKTRSGRVYWADKTYSDPRVLLHIPRGFDTSRPGVIVLFFHGHGATLARDVVARQQLPAQIQNSGINAVLVAPQFAVDARDSSAGNLWQPGGTSRFLDEAAPQLARLLGNPRAADIFRKMPVVIVGYSGGYVPTAATLSNGGIGERIKGVVLLDGLYGELAKFARWIERNDKGFFLSAYATSTRRGNAALKSMLNRRGIHYTEKLADTLRPGSVTFVKAVTGHRDYVTKAWADNPVSDLLARMTGTASRIDPALSASLAAPRTN